MIVEGTWGPFYTIGRFSFLAADSLRRILQDQNVISKAQQTALFLHYCVECCPVCLKILPQQPISYTFIQVHAK